MMRVILLLTGFPVMLCTKPIRQSILSNWQQAYRRSSNCRQRNDSLSNWKWKTTCQGNWTLQTWHPVLRGLWFPFNRHATYTISCHFGESWGQEDIRVVMTYTARRDSILSRCLLCVSLKHMHEVYITTTALFSRSKQSWKRKLKLIVSRCLCLQKGKESFLSSKSAACPKCPRKTR